MRSVFFIECLRLSFSLFVQSLIVRPQIRAHSLGKAFSKPNMSWTWARYEGLGIAIQCRYGGIGGFHKFQPQKLSPLSRPCHLGLRFVTLLIKKSISGKLS